MEVFHRGQRVAQARRHGGPRHGTLPDHMPSAHRLYAEWNPERFQSQARAIGPNTEALIIAVLAGTVGAGVAHLPRHPASLSRHPCGPGRGCLGPSRGDRRAQYQSVASIIEHKLDGKTAPHIADGAPILHTTSAIPLLPLRRTTLLQHPPINQLRELGLEGWPRACVNCRPMQKARLSATWSGSASCSSMR